MNNPHSFNMLPEMTRAQQELQILQKLRIFTVFLNFVEEFNPGHPSPKCLETQARPSLKINTG